jgi:hypothetical protein
MKNLNPIYLLEVKTDTIVKSANKVRNSLVRNGMSEKDATDKVSKRLLKILINRDNKIHSVKQISPAYRDTVVNTPQFHKVLDNAQKANRAYYTFK